MSRENLAFAGAVLASVVVLFAIGEPRPHLLVEDGPIENLAAALFAAAALLAFAAFAVRRASLTAAHAILLVGTGALSMLLFLSEISFGARLFDVRMPQMRGGGEFDGGHDIVIVIARRLRDAGRAGLLVAATAAGLLLVAAIALLSRFHQPAQAMARHVLSTAFEFRLAVAVGMLASAVILDLLSSYKAGVLEEVLELGAGGVLVLAVLARLRGRTLRPSAVVKGVSARTSRR